MSEKVKILYPGEKLPLDSTIKTRNLGSSLFVGLAVFIVITSFLFIGLCKNYYPIEKTHFQNIFGFWVFVIGMVSNYQGSGFFENLHLMNKAPVDFIGNTLVYRWIASLMGGSALGIYLGIQAFKPTGGIEIIRGKRKLQGEEAFIDLKREFDSQCSGGGGSGIVVFAKPVFAPSLETLANFSLKRPFNPNLDSIEDLKPKHYIQFPDEVKTKHHIFIGGTGRGKTQTIKYILISQLYRKILLGGMEKIFMVDTPKGDYSKDFRKEDMYFLSPEELGSISWDVAKDIYNNLLAYSFWEGKIPTPEGDQVWSKAAIEIGTGSTVFHQCLAPESWTYGMLAYMFGKEPKDLLKILKYHPEAKQILKSPEETIGSVMFNLASFTSDLIQLARVFDGFEEKKSVYQATAKALKFDDYLKYISDEMAEDFIEVQDKNDSSVKNQITEEMARFKSLMFKGMVRYFNNRNKKWVWQNIDLFVKQPIHKQVSLLLGGHKTEDGKTISFFDDIEKENLLKLSANPFADTSNAWVELCSNIVHYAKEWDKIEQQKKLSLRDWFTSNNPDKRILVIKPSESFPSLTDGLLRGILSFTDKVILGDLKDSKTRRLHIIIDEFQNIGNIKTYTQKALSLYRSRGCSVSLAFQDISQITDTYGEHWTSFLTSNVASIFLLGTNEGPTNQKFSDLVGEMTFKRAHRTRNSDGGYNEDIQEHQGKVMTPDEFNTLGSNRGDKSSGSKLGTIKLCYIVGGLNPVYILKLPILQYPERSEKIEAKWVKETRKNPDLPIMKEIWALKTEKFHIK